MNFAELAQLGLFPLSFRNADRATANGRCFGNWKESNTKRLQAGWARAQSGTGRLTIATSGDSKSCGSGAGTGSGNIDGARAFSRGSYLKKVLRQRCNGLDVLDNAVFGNMGISQALTGNDYPAFDPRITMPAGWGHSTLITVGANGFSNTTTTNPLGFAPPDPFSAFIIWYVQDTSFATWNLNVDGGSSIGADIVAAGTRSVQTVSRTCTLGTHTLNMQRVSGGELRILAISTYDSAKGQVLIWQWGSHGWASTATSQWQATTQTWSPKNLAPTLGADILLHQIGTNDMDAALQANMYTDTLSFVDAMLPTTDVAICFPQPCGPSKSANGQKFVRDALKAVVNDRDLPYVDVWQAHGGDFTKMSSLGYTAGDIHCNKLGYAVQSNLEVSALLSAPM